MRNVDWSPRALADIERLDGFLRAKNPSAAERATIAIRDAAEGLGLFPERGRPLGGVHQGFRELLVEFGSSGYAILYHPRTGRPIIVAIKHFREEGYS
ncbi:MAG TPA: type II toxin-antitoxin system RelE/ParE family toxin [Devosia sp.]